MAEYTLLDANTYPAFSSDYSSEGEFTSYVTAHDESARPVDELGTHESNRWALQGFFNDPPSLTVESDLSAAYTLQLTDSTYSVDYFTLEDDQAYVDIGALEPDDGDGGVEFSISIGGSLPGIPLSAGISAVDVDTAFNVDDNDYQKTEWNIQYPVGESLPTTQEDSIGVRYDVQAKGTPGVYTIENFQMHGFEVIETTIGGSSSVYSNSVSYYHGQRLEIV